MIILHFNINQDKDLERLNKSDFKRETMLEMTEILVIDSLVTEI